MQEKVRRSNKAHMRLRKSANTKQEAKYHLARAMSQTNILGSKSPDANYSIDTMSVLFFLILFKNTK